MGDMAKLFGNAYLQCNMNNAISGFAACGIHPYDDTLFSDEDFAPSLVTNRPDPPEEGQAGPLRAAPEENQAGTPCHRQLQKKARQAHHSPTHRFYCSFHSGQNGPWPVFPTWYIPCNFSPRINKLQWSDVVSCPICRQETHLKKQLFVECLFAHINVFTDK